MADTIFLESDFWKLHSDIITKNLDGIKPYLCNNTNKEMCGDFELLLSQLWTTIFITLAEDSDRETDMDAKLYKIHELDFIQRRLCRIKIDSFYNDSICKRVLLTDEDWEVCYKFIVDRFDGTFNYPVTV